MAPVLSMLLSIPLSIFSNFATDRLKEAAEKMKDLPLEDIFYRTFISTLEGLKKEYDEIGAGVIDILLKAVKKDKKRLLSSLAWEAEDFGTLLDSVRSSEFQDHASRKLLAAFELESHREYEILRGMIRTVLDNYVSAFFKELSERDGIKLILMKVLKLDSVLAVLTEMDKKMVPPREFDQLRQIVLQHYWRDYPDSLKRVEDYREYISKKFQYIALQGMSPKVHGKEIQVLLENLFIPLEMLPEEKRSGGDEERAFGRQPEKPHREKSEEENEIRPDIFFWLREHRSLVILGDPGSGKSTLLKYLALKALDQEEDSPLTCVVPLFLRVADYADFYRKHKQSLYEYITSHFDQQYTHLYKEAFECSNLLVILDGLDEITDTPLRLQVTRQVMDLTARYPLNRYVISSRLVGYHESRLSGDFKHLKISPFTKKDIEDFCGQWYLAIADNTNKNYEEAMTHAGLLFQFISRSPSVVRLASNPLLMTIIAMIHYKGKKLPNKRVELYDISTETFLEYWVHLRVQDESRLKDREELLEILAPLAFKMHKEKSNGLIEEGEFRESFLQTFQEIHTGTPGREAKKEAKSFINFLRHQTGFFCEKGVDNETGEQLFGFIHLTFEEYLSAIEMVSLWEMGEVAFEEYIFQPRWIEVIRLAASQIRLASKGKAGRTKATRFLRDLLGVEDNFPEAYRPLQLVCLCLADDVSVADEFLDEVLERVTKVLAAMEYEELVKAFSSVFKEILYSDYRGKFIGWFKEKIEEADERLLGNVVRVFMENSGNEDVAGVLTEMLERKEKRFLKAVYGVGLNRRRFAFQKSDIYRENYLSYLESSLYSLKASGYKYNRIGNYLRLIANTPFTLFLSEDGLIPVVKEVLDEATSDTFFTEVLRVILIDFLFSECRSKPFFTIEDAIRKESLFIKYAKHPFIMNIKKSTIMKKTFIATTMTLVRSDNFFLIRKRNGDELQFIVFDYDFKELYFREIRTNEIDIYLKSVEKEVFCSNYPKIQAVIYNLIGPQNNDKGDIEIFNRMVEKDIQFYGSQWRFVPFLNILNNPSSLSKTILRKKSFHFYTKPKAISDNLLPSSFHNPEILPPVRLMVLDALKEPYDPSLIDESIRFYRDCDQELKAGTFAILFRVLNPLE